MNLGNAIKVYMARANMSQTELSGKLLVTQSWLSRIINNRVSASFRSTELIAAALNIKLSDLIIEAEAQEHKQAEL